MLHINDLTYRIGHRLLIDHATVALPDGAKAGLVGPNGAGKTTLFRLISGEIGPESGVDRPAQECAHRPGGAGGAGRPREPDRGGARRRPRARGAARRGRDGARPAPHRRYPHTARRHRFPLGGGARRHHPGRPRLRRGSAAAALFVVLRRLAHARGAGRYAVHAAGPAAPRRADQLSRSRRHAVAGDLRRQVSLQRDHHQPRPRPVEPRRRQHRPSRPGQADALSRRLRFLRPPAARAPGAAIEAEGQAGRTAPAPAILRRPFPLQGVEGDPGAVAPEDAGEDGADRRHSPTTRSCRSTSRLRPSPPRRRS